MSIGCRVWGYIGFRASGLGSRGARFRAPGLEASGLEIYFGGLGFRGFGG